MARKPLWQQFEESSIKERCEMLDYDLHFEINTLYDEQIRHTSNPNIKNNEDIEKEKKYYIMLSERYKKAIMNEVKISKLPQANILGFYIKFFPAFYQGSLPLTNTKLLYKAVIELYNASFRIEASKEAYLNNKIKPKLRKFVKRDVIKKSIYKKIVESYYKSEKWKNFRSSWFQKYPSCHRCGNTNKTMQVHHRFGYNLSRTIIDEGFLEGLKHPERFWTLCMGCHSLMGGFYKPKKPIIIGQKIRDNFWKTLLNKMLKKKIMFKKESIWYWSNIIEITNWNTNISYEIEIAQKFIKIKLWMHNRNQDENKRIFDLLNSNKKYIEMNLGNDLIWKRMDDYRLSLIEFYVTKNIGWASSSDELYKVQVEIIDKANRFEKILKSFKDEINMQTSLFKTNSREKINRLW